MFQKKSISDIKQEELANKKVLVRADFNVPLDDNQQITDDARIVAALPTIKYLLDAKAKVILCSHLGRPKGEVKDIYSLAPVSTRLSELTKVKVTMTRDCVGAEVGDVIASMDGGTIVLLENLRFHKEETSNDTEFAKQLASNADLYVNDAFGTAHRAHASTEGVTKYLPSVAGFLIEKELQFLGNTLDNVKRPFLAIIGGAKVSSKITVLRNLLSKVDTLIIGGGMAYTFLKAKGYEIGDSIVEDDYLKEAQSIEKEAKAKNVNLLLPEDILIADSFSEEANTKVVNMDNIPKNWEGLDIGPVTAQKWAQEVKSAATVVWNGPVGVFEKDKFAKGTLSLAVALAEADNISIIGGGDSAAAIKKFNLTDKMTHISTGGGASLEFLEGKILPGIAALQDR